MTIPSLRLIEPDEKIIPASEMHIGADRIKWMVQELGYLVTRDSHGVERLYRSDGTLAITARPPEGGWDA